MATKTVLDVTQVYGYDSSDTESSSTAEEFNASSDISDNLGDGDLLLSEDDLVAGSKDTTRTVQNSTPTSGNVSNSVSRRLLPSRSNTENETSILPMNDLTNSVPNRSGSFSAAKDRDTQELILQEIRKANSRLDEFAANIKAIETCLDSVENHSINVTPVSTSTSSCAEESGGKIRRKVPKRVSVCLNFTVVDMFM